MLAWDHTPGVGDCALLPDGRVAYIAPCRNHAGQHRLRIVPRPGHRGLADFYSQPKSAAECRALAEEKASRAQAELVRRSLRAATGARS